MLRWYVINTYSGHENKVRANILRRVETQPPLLLLGPMATEAFLDEDRTNLLFEEPFPLGPVRLESQADGWSVDQAPNQSHQNGQNLHTARRVHIKKL